MSTNRDIQLDAGAAWEMASALPAARLRPYVHNYVGYVERAANLSRRRTLPSGKVVLIIGGGEPLRITSPGDAPGDSHQHRSFVAALNDAPGSYEWQGESRGVQVDLTPLGARMIFGVPMHELTNRACELDDLLGPDVRTLASRVVAAPDYDTAFDLLDEALVSRAACATPPSEAAAWVWRQIERTGGNASIGALATEIGWSRKHLVEVFRDQVGLAPKTAARVLRFARAMELLSAPAVCLADVAARCGYYDQAHFCREVAAFSGSTPGEILAGLHGEAPAGTGDPSRG